MFHGHRATTTRRVDKIFAKHRIRLDMYRADESCKASTTKNNRDQKCHLETYITDNGGENQDPKGDKKYFRKKVSFEPEVKVYENCSEAQEMHVRRRVDDKLNEEDLMKLSKKELVAMIMAQG